MRIHGPQPKGTPKETRGRGKPRLAGAANGPNRRIAGEVAIPAHRFMSSGVRQVVVAALVTAAVVGAGLGVWFGYRRVPSSSGTVYAVPASISADGSIDVTAELNSFIASVPSGRANDLSIVRFRHSGRYRVEGRVLVADKTDFVLEGNGATLFATIVGAGSPSQVANRYHLTLRGGSDLTVRGFTILGVNPNPGHLNNDICCQHGIVVEGTRGALITRNTIRNVYGDNVYITPFGSNNEISPDSIHIVYNTFIGNGRQGLAIVGGSNIWIQHNLFDGAGLSSVDLEPNHSSDPITFVHLVGNTFANSIGAAHRGSAISAEGAAPVAHVEILNNMVTWGNLGVTASSPSATNRQTDWVIRENIVTSMDPGHSAFGYLQFKFMDRVVVDSNRVTLADGRGVAVWVVSDASNSVHVINNTVKNARPFLSCINGSTDCWESANRS